MLNFSTVKLAPSPHPPLPAAIPYSFGKKICTQPIVKDGWLCSSSFRVEYLFKLFEILVHGRFFFSTVTCIQPFIYISMIHGYLFYTLGWPWSKKWSRAKANRVLAREHTGHSKDLLPTTQEMTLHMDITRWSIPKLDWLYSLQSKMEKLYTVSKNKTWSWLWLRSLTHYKIQTQTEESRENH